MSEKQVFPPGETISSSFLCDDTWSIDILKMWTYYLTDKTGKDPVGVDPEMYQFLDQVFSMVVGKKDRAAVFVRQDGRCDVIYPGGKDKDDQEYITSVDHYLHADLFQEVRSEKITTGRLYIVNIIEVLIPE